MYTNERVGYFKAKGDYMLIHDFVLVSKVRLPLMDLDTIDITSVLNDATILQNHIMSISDDVVLHFISTLKRVPSINGCGAPFTQMYGINYYGITVFDEKSAPIIQAVFQSWIEQLSALKTISEWIDLLSIDEEYGQKVDKTQILKTLNTMLDLTEHLKSGHYYLVHFGI